LTGSIIVAVAILVATAALIYFFRPRKDPRVEVRTLVRAVEKRAEWDTTIETEHVKRARVKLAMGEMFPKMSDEWIDMYIEEAVFDSERRDVYELSRRLGDPSESVRQAE
jgi:hypothetical protein